MKLNFVMFQILVRVLLLVVFVVGYLELVNCAYSDTSETREVLSLDGIWNCYCERDSRPLDYREKHGLRMLSGIVKVPVPGSLVDFDLKNCPAAVWFERSFFVPKTWKFDRQIFLRLDGLTPNSSVWINGEHLECNMTNFIELDVTEKLVYESENRIALEVKKIPKNLNLFAGVSRSIVLRSVPEILSIQSVSIETFYSTNGTGLINFKIEANGLLRLHSKCVSVQVFDKDNVQVAYNTSRDSLEGCIAIPNCNLWWPLCMDSRAGYLYTMVFKLYYKYCESDIKDVYRLKVGIRPLRWSDNTLMINDKSFYLQGVRASDEWAKKPFSPSMELKDMTLLKWLNANALVTSIAPSEETLDLADEMGLFVVLGSPKNVLEDVIIRYRHHPSVIMWSISDGGGEYCPSKECDNFNDTYIDCLKYLDPTRPLTADLSLFISEEMKFQRSQLDILTIGPKNDLSDKISALRNEIVNEWKKPVIIMHGDESVSTKNRIRTLNFDSVPEGNERFDSIRRSNSVIGEFYGNFISYECFKGEVLTLIDGMFDRNREPTAGADFVRSKFRPKRSPCVNRAPKCKFNKNRRKRMLRLNLKE